MATDSAQPAALSSRAQVWRPLPLLFVVLIILISCTQPQRPSVAVVATPEVPRLATTLPEPTRAPDTPLPALSPSMPPPTFTPLPEGVSGVVVPTATLAIPPTPTLLPKAINATDVLTSPRPTIPIPPPPTPTAPLAQVLRKLKGDLLIYNGPEYGGALMLADIASGRQIWLTAELDDGPCKFANTMFEQGGLWSPDGRFLAITCWLRELPQGSYLPPAATFVLDLQSGTFQQVRSADPRRQQVIASEWAPTGHRLLIYEEHGTQTPANSWLIVDIDTGARRSLIDFTDYSRASWSPDGTRLALSGRVGDEQSASAAYLINADGTRRRQLFQASSPGLNILDLGWSRDGMIAYFLERSASPHDHGNILPVEVDTGKVISRGAPPWGEASPDGRWYLTSDWTEPSGRIWWLVEADGTVLRRLSDNPEEVQGATWMPDGRLLVWACQGDRFKGPWMGQLALVGVRGGEQVIARYEGCAGTVDMSADASLLAMSLYNRIIVLDLRGRTKAVIPGHWISTNLTHQGMWRPRR